MAGFSLLNLGAGGTVNGAVLHVCQRGKPTQFDAAIFADRQDEPMAVYLRLDGLSLQVRWLMKRSGY